MPFSISFLWCFSSSASSISLVSFFSSAVNFTTSDAMSFTALMFVALITS